MALPLWRRRLVVTRPRARAVAWVQGFTEAGADVVVLPAFELRPPDVDAQSHVRERFRLFAESNEAWLAITSPTSVEHFLSLIDDTDVELLRERFAIACVGGATRELLESHGYDIEIVPSEPGALPLIDALLGRCRAPHVLHVCSSQAPADLVRRVRSVGGVAERAVVSEHEAITDQDLDRFERNWDDFGVDLLTFASPSAAQALIARSSAQLVARMQSTRTLAVGATTAAALRDAAFSDVVMSPRPEFRHVLATAIAALGGSDSSPAARESGD